MGVKVHCEPADGSEAGSKRRAKKQVLLVRVLQDAYEYHGITRLAQLLVFYIIGQLVIYYHWGDSAPDFRSSVVESFKSFGPADSQQTQLTQFSTMSSGMSYMTGYLGQAVDDSQSRALPTEAVYITEYSRIRFARLVVNLELSCSHPELLCYRNEALPPSFNTTWQPLITSNWHGGDRNWLHSLPDLLSTTLVSDNMTYADMQANLSTVLAQEAYVAKYASIISLEMVVYHDMEKQGPCFFNIKVQRATNGEGVDSLNAKVTMLSNTFPIKTILYFNTFDFIRLLAEILFIVCVLLGWSEEWQQFQLALWQYHSNPNAACGTQARTKLQVARRFVCNIWNFLDIVSLLCSSLGVLSYAFMASQVFPMMDADVGANNEQLDRVMRVMVLYSGFLYACVFNNFVIGVRIYQYMKVHKGLRIYYNLFIRAFKSLKDFVMFFVYVLMLLGTSVLAFFQISGGSPYFTSVMEGISTMALLTFGYFDYDAFKNADLGLGSWRVVSTVVFWLTVILLVVVSQNIILAIFSSAYDEAQSNEGQVDMTLLTVALLRLVWHAIWVWRWLTKRQDRRAFIKHVLSKNMDPNSVWCRAFGAWAVACLPEAYTLLAYYTDFVSMMFYRRSPWESNKTAVHEPGAVHTGPETRPWKRQLLSDHDTDGASAADRAFLLKEGADLHEVLFDAEQLWALISYIGDAKQAGTNHFLDAKIGIFRKQKAFVWDDPSFMMQAILQSYGTGGPCSGSNISSGDGSTELYDRRATLDDYDACLGVFNNAADASAGVEAPANQLESQLASMQQQMQLLLQIASAQAQLAMLQSRQPLQQMLGRAGAVLPHTSEMSDDEDIPRLPGPQQLTELVSRIESLVRQAQA